MPASVPSSASPVYPQMPHMGFSRASAFELGAERLFGSADDHRRNAARDPAIGQIVQHQGVRADDALVTDMNRPQHRRVREQVAVVANRREPRDGIGPPAARAAGDALKNSDAAANARAAADDDP